MQSPPAQPSNGSTPPAQPSGGAAPSAGSTPPAGMQGGPSATFSDALDGLVSDGTITSTQKTAIQEALTSAMPGPGSGQAPSGATGTSTQSS
jgi:hypothetical protein